jgi:hypothetical protein
MAKKTRIDRRGKIRSIVTRWNFTNNLPHWSVTKRAAVWERRRAIDDLWLTETISVSDVLLKEQERGVSSGSTVGDAVNINDEKVILNSATFSDDGTIVKNFESPSNASGATVSDSIGFELGTLSSVFNTGKINDMLFNAVGYDQEFYTDSVTASDAVSLNAQNAKGDTASVSDSIGFAFQIGSVFNSAAINLSQFNG